MINFFHKSRDGNSHGSNNNIKRPRLEFCIIIEPSFDSFEDIMPKAITPEESDVKNFMMSYVTTVFKSSCDLTLEQKSTFGKYVQSELGQTWFARVVNAQRAKWRCVTESTFYSLVQHFAIVLFECANSDFYSPAKILMNMCFTFYHEIQVPGCEPFREYLSTYLRNQPIWKNLRFWNAAFFDALQCARIQRPVITQNEIDESGPEAIVDENQFLENITFGQLGTFICNMHAFGLDKSLCADFLEKQHTIASLPKSQEQMLHEHMNRLYEQTDPYF